MPDISGFGRGLLKGALSATERAAEKVKDAAEAASRKISDDDDPDATQVVSNETTTDADATQVVSKTTTSAADEDADEDADADATQVVPSSPTTAPPSSPGHPAAPAAFGDSNARPQPPGSPSPPHPSPAPPGGSQALSVGSATPPTGTQALDGTPSRPPGGAQAPNGSPSTPPGGTQLPKGAPVTSPNLATPLAPAPPHPGPTPPGNPPSHFADPAGEIDTGEPTLVDEPDEPDEHADPADVREFVEMFQQLMARRRPPAGPIPGEWSIGVGDLFAEHPKVPKRVRGLVTRLNRFGGLSYSPQEITFDGEDVPWEKVTEVRTRHVVDYLIGDAVQQQVDNLPMPWFPGRKRLLDALGQAMLIVTIATAKTQLEKYELDLRVPAEIAYKASFGRTKELNAGVLSALVLADPAVNASVLATARARGIPVTEGDDELLADAGERAEKIREKVATLEAELEKFMNRFGRTG